MFSPIGGPGMRAGAGLSININIGGGAPTAPLGGGGSPCCCQGGLGDGFSPSAELSQGGISPGFGLSPFGPPGLNAMAAQMASNPLPDFTKFLDSPNPGFAGGGGALPAAMLLGGGGGGFGTGLPPIGGGSLANQAMMMQAASSDMNQASLINAQTGVMGGLAAAQGTALAGINPLMSGLMSNFG